MKRWAGLLLLLALWPMLGAAEEAAGTDEQIAAGIEQVIGGMDFAEVSDIELDVPGWPGGPTVSQRIPSYPTSLRTSNPSTSR